MKMINSTLPIHIKVLEKTGFNNYTLLLNHSKMTTKSYIELELGGEYLAELYEGKGGILSFKNLAKKPKIAYFEGGLELIVKLLEQDFNFKEYILKALILSKSREEFELFKEMLFASVENIYHIPFIFENKLCLFQLRKSIDKIELFLYFSVFGNLLFIIDGKGVSLFTPFAKVAAFLNKFLDIEVLHDKNCSFLFEYKRLLDYKG